MSVPKSKKSSEGDEEKRVRIGKVFRNETIKSPIPTYKIKTPPPKEKSDKK